MSGSSRTVGALLESSTTNRNDPLLKAALLGALTGSPPNMRARIVDGLSRLELDQRLAANLAPLLSDPYWLVRLLTIDLFAARQGRLFGPVLQKMSDTDPDRLVRRLAALLLARLEAGGVESTAP